MKKMIKRILVLSLCVMIGGLSLHAQSMMSDDQVAAYVKKEYEAGTSQAQIVSKLMQRGVNIEQIRRVRKKYENNLKNQDMVTAASGGILKRDDDRTRKDNGQKNNDISEMEGELSGLLPDTLNLDEEVKEIDRTEMIFGHDIFNRKDLTFEPNMNIATPQNYRIGPGDVVYIDVYGASQKTFECTVSPDATVTIEGYGPVEIGGLTVEQANLRLKSLLGERYSSSNIRLTVGQTRTIMVNVMGEVTTPGTYTLSAFASVFHALYMAGGVSDVGTLRDIKVYRNNKLLSSVDIYDYILNGKQTGNVRLEDNDVIVVGAYDCLVKVEGKVKRPMFYEMKKTESVGRLIGYSGGFAGDAYRDDVRLMRKSGREYSIHTVNEFDMSGFTVADGDVVIVDSVTPRYSNMVEVRGSVLRPGMFQLGGNISTVRELILAAGGLTEDAFLNRAVMHRYKEDLSLEALAINVKGVLDGTVADIPLRKNDVLYIPNLNEMRLDQLVKISGKVNNPGEFPYAENMTVEDLILQAGGLAEGASTVKVDVYRRINNPKATTVLEEMVEAHSFSLRDGFVVDGEPGFVLQPFDEIYVRENPAYSVQQSVKVSGSVNFAGDYVMTTRDYRLSDLVNSAGGLSPYAYSKGAKLVRKMSEEEMAQKEIALKNAQIQLYEEAMQADKQFNMAHADSLLELRMELGNFYVVAIDLDKALADRGGLDDVLLREGDILYVPEFNNTVKVSGEVMSAVSLNFQKGKSLSYYIKNAGGYSSKASKSKIYAVYMNGAVKKLGRSGKDIEPGCEIVVPAKQTKNKLTTAERMSIGTSTASIAAMIATLINALK